MRSAIIVGSGPAAAGAALALTAGDECAVTVVDIGTDLEPSLQAARDRAGGLPPTAWDPEDIRLIAATAVRDAAVEGLPEKRSYGSDYPFRDAGQLAPLAVESGVASGMISSAYGGYSTVWGAQFLSNSDAAFRDWPVTAGEMAPHYAAVLAAVPFSATDDDLAAVLPLHARPLPPMPLSPRAAAVLANYERNRESLNRAGLLLGQSRVAVRSPECVRCGMCMTGCPYSLIYSAAQTFDQLRARGRITYASGLLAVGLEEDGAAATVVARHQVTGETHRFSADRVFVACGAVGTTRLVLDSLRWYGRDVVLHESAQFVLPFVSRRSTGNPLAQQLHALGQLSALLQVGEPGAEPLHLQLYTYNPAFIDALPGPLRGDAARPRLGPLLDRLSVSLGYLPSSMSPRLRVRLIEPAPGGGRAPLAISRDPSSPDPSPVLRALAKRLLRLAPRLDLWPVIPRLALSAPGKSYHWGGTFPHDPGVPRGPGQLTTDRTGRLPAWQRIHLVDAAVAPSLSATSFTLTLMANAHRIAAESLSIDAGAGR